MCTFPHQTAEERRWKTLAGANASVSAGLRTLTLRIPDTASLDTRVSPSCTRSPCSTQQHMSRGPSHLGSPWPIMPFFPVGDGRTCPSPRCPDGRGLPSLRVCLFTPKICPRCEQAHSPTATHQRGCKARPQHGTWVITKKPRPARALGHDILGTASLRACIGRDTWRTQVAPSQASSSACCELKARCHPAQPSMLPPPEVQVSGGHDLSLRRSSPPPPQCHAQGRGGRACGGPGGGRAPGTTAGFTLSVHGRCL